LSVAESWDRRESNLKKRGHLLTAAELKRRGITRYDAEMLLSQGFALPEPKTHVSSPLGNRSRLYSSTPTRFSPRTRNKAPLTSTKSIPSTPARAGDLQKSAAKHTASVRQGQKDCVNRTLRSRTASHQQKLSSGRRLGQSAADTGTNARTRRMAKQAAKHADVSRTDSGDDGGDSSSESSLGSCEDFERKADVDVALSMSCETIQSESSPWRTDRTMSSPACVDTVLTPSKLRMLPRRLPVTAQSSDDCMPLLKKESNETSTPSLVTKTRLKSSDRAHGDDMPVLEKEQDEDLLASGPDSSVDSGCTSSSAGKPEPSLAHRCRRHLELADRRFGYDTREWRVPKLTIRRRRASGQSFSSSSGMISSTSLSSSGGRLIYEILPTCGHGSVESQPTSDDSSYSDQKSTSATSSPDTISPTCFYGGETATAGRALKRLRLKFGEESVAIDVGGS